MDTSDLRVAFGGLTSQPVSQATPSGMVQFDDLPPGWLASSTRTVVDAGPNAALMPIVQGTVHLNRNLMPAPAGAGPSYLEAYYTTLVHEMGHALGLQHTYTSSAMSTSPTRSTSRAKPIDADDVAGLSLLYGRVSSFGTITGRVTSGGQPLHMASVVALQQSGPAVSALTNPDGTYRIDGVPPGSYWVYVHPLPPSADFQYPTDPTGVAIAPTGSFETLFYQRGTGGTRDPGQFTAIDVSRGGTVPGVDFTPQRRGTVPLYDVTGYSYFGQNPVSPAYLNVGVSPGTLVAVGNGLLSGGMPATGLGAQILGGSGSIYATLPWETGLALYLTYPSTAPAGPRHILFTLPNDAYVLPSAFNLVQKQPPSIASVSQNSDGTVTVTGSNMGPDSRVFFDGVQAAVRAPFAGSDQLGQIVVALPQGANNQTATVAAYNADGQNSMFTQQLNPPVYAYGFQDPGTASVNPASLPAGVSAMVEVNWPNARFLDNPATVGFGTSDVFVRRVWVLSQTRLLANVAVAANAISGSSLLNVSSGFETFSQPFGFQVQPANPKAPYITLPLANATPGQSGIYPGATVSIFGNNLALSPSGVTVTLNDQSASVVSASAGQVKIMVPLGLPQGPAILRLNNGAEQALPVVVQVDQAPPVVVTINGSGGQQVDMMRPAQAGDVLSIVLSNLDAAVAGSAGRLRVNIGGVEIPALVVLPMSGQQFMFQAQIILPPLAPGLQVPLTVALDGGSPSNPVFIAIR